MSRRTGWPGGPGGTGRVLAVLGTTLVALLAGGLGGLGGLSPSPAAAAPLVEETDGLPVDIAITTVSPQVLQPGQDLTVTVRVRNDGETPVAEPRVVLSLDRSTFIGRFSLDRWRAAEPTDPVGSDLLVSDLPAALAPGQQTTVQLVVPAAQIRLPERATSWGARGLAVFAVDRADPARARLGVARTFALWFPPQDVNATRVSVLAPVVGPAADATTDAWVPGLEAATSDGGRLADVLGATADEPGVTWLLDPWLLDATSGDVVGADSPDDDQSDDSPNNDDQDNDSAQAWGDELREAMTDREVQLLPYLDADLTALAHAARDDLLDAAIRRSEEAARTHGLPDAARVSLALPAADEPDLVTASLAGESGDLAVVVGPGTLPPPAVLTYTPSGRSTVSAGGRAVTVLVPDARLSAALATGRVAVEDAVVGPDARTTTAVTPAVAVQDLLAELAVITRERPNDSRHVLVTTPRDWSPDVDVAAAQLAALASAPWVRLEPVSALIGLADPEIDRGTLPARSALEEEIGAAEITSLETALERRLQLAAMLADPAAAVGDVELELLAPLSVAWRDDPTERSMLVSRVRAANTLLADAVTVSPTTEEGINVLSTSADLPVNIDNALREPVTVSVRLRPDDPRLRVDESVEVTVPAESQVTVRVPVHAVQSADVRVTVEVRTPDGTLVDDDTTFLVRVRAEWEGIGAAILGSLLALALVVGLVRTIRRGRTARRAAPDPEAGPDALSPEQDEEEARL